MRKQPRKIAPTVALVTKPSLFDRFEEQPLWHMLILLIVPFYIYIKAADFEFIHMDDISLIQNNVDILDHWQNIIGLFKTDIFLSHISNMYRPVQSLSFMLDTIIGSGRPLVYHVSNIIYHLLTVLSLYALLRMLNIKNLTAFILSFFFALHPLLSGAVAWVPARAEILVCLWTILSLFNLAKYIKTKKNKYAILHFIFFLLAVYTKETAVLLPALFLFYILTLNEKTNSKKIILFFVTWSIIVVAFLYMRSKAIAQDMPAGTFGLETFINNLPALPILLTKIFFPVNLSPMPLFDNSFETAGWIILAVLFIVALKKYTLRQRLPLIGFVWFVLLLAACLPFQLRDTKFLQAYPEQEVYLPLIGTIILLAYLLNEKLQQPARTIYAILSLLIVIVFVPVASVYSDSYKDSEAYFTNAADLHNPGAYTKLGEEYLNRTSKNYDNAIADFNSAVEFSGGLYAPAYFDLGRATSDHLKNHQDAESDFSQAIALDSTVTDFYIDRGYERLLVQNPGGAIADLNKARTLDSTDERIYYTYGKVYVGLRDLPNAIVQYSKAVSINPFHSDAYCERGVAYYLMKNYPAAIKDESKSISINGLFTAYYNKAMVYYAMNKMDTALKLFDTTLALADNLYDGYFYRASTKKQLHDMKGACSDWQEAVSLGYTPAEDSIKRYCK